MKVIRLGAGAGFSGDRIEPAVALAKQGNLDYLVFECLAERTIALAQGEKSLNPAKGYDPLLKRRFEAVLKDCVSQGTKIITNMGAANPVEGAKAILDVARSLNLTGIKIAAVVGDDVLEQVMEQSGDGQLPCLERTISTHSIISANAYLGAAPIVQALEQGADIVITGRAADPVLYLAPLMYEFNWSFSDWDNLGKGTLCGHLLECAAQISGGYFADGYAEAVPNLSNIGFPIVEVCEDGTFVISKLADTGGLISKQTCTEQLLYEIHDPCAYYQPDVIADFSSVDFEELGKDEVKVYGGKGKPKTGLLKVSVGYSDGWIGEGQISYAGPYAVERGQMAIDIIHDRLKTISMTCEETRGELIGVNSVIDRPANDAVCVAEVRMRFAARCSCQEDARQIGEEVEALYLSGPAGGGGVSKSFRKIIAVASVFIEESKATPSIEILES